MIKIFPLLTASIYCSIAFSQTPAPDLFLEGNQYQSFFGSDVANAGDVNGDGFNDLIVGSQYYDAGQFNEGAAFIYYGSVTGIDPVSDVMIQSDKTSAWMGNSVCGCGDLNGDGYDDIAIGAHLDEHGEGDEGLVFIYYGSATGIDPGAYDRLESNQSMAYFGGSVAGAGDVNNDGFDDLIVGASSYDNGQANEGRTYIFHGSAGGILHVPALTLESNQHDANFGVYVSGAGDINGDNYDDVLIASNSYDNGEVDEGRVFVYLGSATGINPAVSATVESDQILGDMLVVAGGGDVNNDGYDDIAMSAILYDFGGPDRGRIYFYYGNSTGISASPDLVINGTQDGEQLGRDLDLNGDINGDGFNDLIAGAAFYSNEIVNEGAVFVYFGSASGITATPSLIFESDQTESYFGNAINSGDMNNDGFDDILIGAERYDNGIFDEGAVMIFNGTCTGTTEVCNASDDDCNGLIDDGVVESINISAGDATTFCQGGSTLLTASYSGASVQWKKNGSDIAGATASTYSVNKSGNYSAVTTSPCGTATSTIINVTVNKNPNASISAAGATSFCAGGSVTLTEIAVAGCTYQWYKGASLIGGATSTNYVATTAGNYRCRVTKTATGCYKNSNAISVTVPCREEGLIGENNSSFTIYPNPNNGTFILSAKSARSAGENIQIYNSLGELIYSQQINSTDNNFSQTISLNNISSGIYFVRLSDAVYYMDQMFIIE